MIRWLREGCNCWRRAEAQKVFWAIMSHVHAMRQTKQKSASQAQWYLAESPFGCIHALSHWMTWKLLAVLNTISASPLFWEVVHCGIEMVLSNMSCQEALFSYWLNWCGAWFLPCCLTNLDATSVHLTQLFSAAPKPGKTATMNNGWQHLPVVTQTLLPGSCTSENYIKLLNSNCITWCKHAWTLDSMVMGGRCFKVLFSSSST